MAASAGRPPASCPRPAAALETGRSRPGATLAAALLTLLPLLPLLVGSVADSGLPLQPDPAVEGRVDSLLRASIAHIYSGRLDLAALAVEDAAATAPADPRPGMFRFRILRANYPDGVDSKERARRQAPMLLEHLDSSIALCDSILALDETSAAAYLYRGWAHMMKAQTHVIAGRVRAAAAASKRGKKDLDRFYKHHPAGDPDADAVLGGFLYFADILPAYLKFIRWIIRVPGGDQERGLELMHHGIHGEGYGRIDSELVLAVIYYVFEGRISEAAAIFDRLQRAHPWHPRVVRYVASLSYLMPETTLEASTIQSRLIHGWGDRVRGWDDAFLHRLRWSRCALLEQAGLYRTALEELRAIARDAPAEPPWLMPRTLLGIAELERNLGRQDSAIAICERLLSDDRFEQHHAAARRLSERPASARDVAVFTELGPALQALHGGRLQEARRMADRIGREHGPDARLALLEGELARRQRRHAEAAAAYRRAVDLADDHAQRPLRQLALLRLAEADVQTGDLDDARSCYRRVRKLQPRGTLLANIARGRLKFVRALARDEVRSTPAGVVE